MSPIKIEVMLKAYYEGRGFQITSSTSISKQEAIKFLVDEELIECDSYTSGYHATERGRKYVKMLIETPLPIYKLVDPREEEL